MFKSATLNEVRVSHAGAAASFQFLKEHLIPTTLATQTESASGAVYKLTLFKFLLLQWVLTTPDPTRPKIKIGAPLVINVYKSDVPKHRQMMHV